MEKRAVAYFRLGSHPSLSATLRCLFTIRMFTLMRAFVALEFNFSMFQRNQGIDKNQSNIKHRLLGVGTLKTKLNVSYKTTK